MNFHRIKKKIRLKFKSIFELVFPSYILVERRAESSYLSKDVPMSVISSHLKWQEYLYKNWNKPGMRILEVGSREVVKPSNARKRFDKAEYIGFDFYPGENVDKIGDAHKLSHYFKPGEKFDLIYSSACFEHFAMPWVVAIEISKLLKVGGGVFVETHFSFSSHERPWNFFQFSDMGLKTLFSPALGYECIEAGFSNPIVGRFSIYADEYLKNRPVNGLYCHSSYLGIKKIEIENFKWDDVKLEEIVEGTLYPNPRIIKK